MSLKLSNIFTILSTEKKGVPRVNLKVLDDIYKEATYILVYK